MIKKLAYLALPLTILLSGASTSVYATDDPIMLDGARVYYNNCQHCHGEQGRGDGHLVEFLKIKPADLALLGRNDCVAKKVLRAVLGKHQSGADENQMPLLKDVVSVEQVYAVTKYIESLQK